MRHRVCALRIGELSHVQMIQTMDVRAAKHQMRVAQVTSQEVTTKHTARHALIYHVQ